MPFSAILSWYLSNDYTILISKRYSHFNIVWRHSLTIACIIISEHYMHRILISASYAALVWICRRKKSLLVADSIRVVMHWKMVCQTCKIGTILSRLRSKRDKDLLDAGNAMRPNPLQWLNSYSVGAHNKFRNDSSGQAINEGWYSRVVHNCPRFQRLNCISW